MTVTLEPVRGLGEIRTGDDLGGLIAGATSLRDGDIVVVAQKVVSKAEGRVRDLRAVAASERARELARRLSKDARLVQVVLEESRRLVREERVLITETHHGFICANAGVDHSNTGAPHEVTLLPVDCDASARRLRVRFAELCGAEVGVIVSDTFGRPWRLGLCNVALGIAGMPACVDLRGTPDGAGRGLQATVVALADEVAAAAGLVMGKAARTPAAVVRGLDLMSSGAGTGRDLLRPDELDLFR